MFITISCFFCSCDTRYDVELKKHELYVIEPSGVMYRYFGAAVGKGRQVHKKGVFFVFFARPR